MCSGALLKDLTQKSGRLIWKQAEEMTGYMIFELRRCQDCGQPVGARDKFCARCGAKLPREPKATRFE